MPNSFTIEIQGLDRVNAALAGAPALLTQKLDYAFEKSAREIELRANQRKPVDMGGMQVRVDSQPLRKEITVNAPYAPFIEFGTGRYAAQYVSTLPDTWQQFAATYKGQSGGGSFHDFLIKMTAWVHRKGLAGNVSQTTGRRRGNRATQANEDKQVAYLIARSILINGVRPHPFLYPSFNEVLPTLQADINQIITTFGL